MCCQGLSKTVANGQRIAKGFAYLAAGVNQELSESRVKICNNCPQLRGGLVCAQCGCEVHAKSRLPEESCPIGKWGPEGEPPKRWNEELPASGDPKDDQVRIPFDSPSHRSKS